MKKLIMALLFAQGFMASASALEVEGESKVLRGEACLGLKSTSLSVDEDTGDISIKTKIWYHASGGAAGHNKEVFLFSKLKEGSFQTQGEEQFFMLGNERALIAQRDDSFFASYRWKLQEGVKIQIREQKVEGHPSFCRITPVLTIGE